MSYSLEIKSQAVKFRKAGRSIKEIANILNISVSTSSAWLREISISKEGQKHMRAQASLHRHKTSLRFAQKRLARSFSYQKQAKKILKQITFTNPINKLICAMLFWAEGAKTSQRLAFTNSDPKMIEFFLYLLRKSYKLDESKFRVSVHLHEYHDKTEMLDFWSKITCVPIDQFIKPYIKPHTGLRKKENYNGCITVRYYNSKIACELEALYSTASFMPAAFYNALHTL